MRSAIDTDKIQYLLKLLAHSTSEAGRQQVIRVLNRTITYIHITTTTIEATNNHQ